MFRPQHVVSADGTVLVPLVRQENIRKAHVHDARDWDIVLLGRHEAKYVPRSRCTGDLTEGVRSTSKRYLFLVQPPTRRAPIRIRMCNRGGAVRDNPMSSSCRWWLPFYDRAVPVDQDDRKVECIIVSDSTHNGCTITRRRIWTLLLNSS